MVWPLLLAVLLLAITLGHFKTKRSIHRDGHRLKQPPHTLPLFGNAIKFLQPRNVLFHWFVHCQKSFGLETYEISVPTLPPGVVIQDPRNLEFVLKNEKHITKGEFFRRRTWDLFGGPSFSPAEHIKLSIIGHGIINANGELWKAQRKAGLSFFSGTSLESFVETVLPEAFVHTRIRLLEYTQSDSVVDIQDVFLELTTKAVGRMAYSMDIDSSSPFSRAFDYASDRVGLRFQNPLYRVTELFTGLKFRTSIAEVKAFGQLIVKHARRRQLNLKPTQGPRDSQSAYGNLIDSLLEAFDDPSIAADAALNLLSAGRDTTAQSLTWTFYLLMRHPSCNLRLHREILQAFPSNVSAHSTRKIDSAELQTAKLPYTTAVFYEALRLYPPVPFEIKQCEIDITLPDGTFLPTGSIVVWCIWAMNRSAEIWGQQGPDLENFEPERWLQHGKFVGKSAFDFPVFNGGPRSCLGKKMAEIMALYVMVRIVQEFDFNEVRDCEQPERERRSQNSLTLPMQDGLPCKVRLVQRTC